MKRRHLLAAAALAAIPQSGRAQAFPERPIRFIVPYAPGGSTDTSARIVSEKLAAVLGQPVMVENKAGGGTIIGTEIVAKSKPDGYTILLTPAAMIANRRVRHGRALRHRQGSRAGRGLRRPADAAGRLQQGAVQDGRRADRLGEGRSRPHRHLCLGRRRQR